MVKNGITISPFFVSVSPTCQETRERKREGERGREREREVREREREGEREGQLTVQSPLICHKSGKRMISVFPLSLN